MTDISLQAIVSALSLPASCRIDQRVPKKLLIENAAPTAADKRLLNNAIEEIQWIAALKPHTVGVPAYRDEDREYLEVSVLSIATRRNQGVVAVDGADPGPNTSIKLVNMKRLAELVHRAVPYPLLLLLTTPHGLLMSMAHKRWAQKEVGKVVLDGDVLTIDMTGDDLYASPFMESLTLARQPQTTLMTLYQGWLDRLTALQAAYYTGTFKGLDDTAQAVACRAILQECQLLEQEAARLCTLASQEKQMAKRVDLNLALKRVQADLMAARKQF